MFQSEVTGPLDLGAMMCAFVEVYDESGALITPPDATVQVQAEKSSWPGVVLTVGDKGPGRCEFAPLMGNTTVYTFQLWLGWEPVSDVARCDLGLPFAVPGEGQYHKSFFVRFRPAPTAPPPPPVDWRTQLRDIATILDLEAARLRDLAAA